ncbi:permease-like cell division protein FtsX [Salsuginibacillus kocurii]|uniref:permease-like cell division protein FtsX n=1 Tax=Salsuginibacillus kocurii TaxID=427078 RepID=UPI0003662E0A|nr:permease-like cell division protein FtsX [Salsuginibacillus kocurii]
MKGRTFTRHVKEGFKNIGRNGWMSFASISAVTVMLLVVGVFLLLIANINYMMTEVEEDVEIRVYMDLTADEEDQVELGDNIASVDHVESITYLHRDDGLDEFIDSVGEENAELFESLRDENPLNDVYIVEAEEPHLTETVAADIAQFSHIDDLDYGESVVEQLFAFTNVMRIAGAVLVLGLMFTAMFLISNTIKLTIINRRDEIQIMKLVGATNGFIRWPFFMEGLMLGVIGSIIPIAAIITGYTYLYETVREGTMLSFINLMPIQSIVYEVSIVLFIIGAIVGVWGSLNSVRKFLKV